MGREEVTYQQDGRSRAVAVTARTQNMNLT